MWEIRIDGVNGRNGVDGEPGTIWSHVEKFIGNVNREPTSCELSEDRLAYMDRDVTIFVFDQSKCSN